MESNDLFDEAYFFGFYSNFFPSFVVSPDAVAEGKKKDYRNN